MAAHSLDETQQRSSSLARANRELSDMIFGGRSFSGRERHCVFLNTGPGDSGPSRFANASAVSGLDLDDDGRALAFVDWDFDGDLDVWISNRNAPRLRFLRNDAETNHHFLALRLQGNGVDCNRDAIGARVEVHLGNSHDPPLLRTLHAGEGFLAQSSKWIHFGLGPATQIDKVVVRWPGGQPQTYDNLNVDGHFEIRQDAGVAEPWTPPARHAPLVSSRPTSLDDVGAARIQLAYRLPMVSVPYENNLGFQQPLTLNSGRPTWINLWASWCRPCLSELDEITKRQAEINEAGIDVLALSVDRLEPEQASVDTARQIMERLEFPFSWGFATPGLLSTFQSLHDRQIPMRLPLPLPTSFLVDRQGQLAAIYKGPVSVDQLLADVSRDELSSRDRFVSAAPFSGISIPDHKVEAIRGRVETMVRFRLGMDLERSGQFDQAAIHYRAALVQQPDYAEAHNNYGNVLARLKHPNLAETHLRRAIALNPSFDLAHHNLGNVLLSMQNIDEAIEHYQEAVRLAPRHAGYRYSLGNAWLSRGEFRAAADCFRQATLLDAQFADAHNNLGFALEKLGETALATESYRRALKVNPRHRRAALNLRRVQETANRL